MPFSRIAAAAFVLLTLAPSRGPAAPATAPAEFVHPAAAWSLGLPAGHGARAFVDAAEVPFHVITAEAGDDPAEFKAGLWVYTIPIPTDDQLEPALLIPLVSNLITGPEPRLKLAADRRAPADLGGVKGIVVDVSGRRAKAGEWRGQVVIAVAQDHCLALHFGGPPEQWDATRELWLKALRTLVSPLKLRSLVAVPPPAAPQRPEDVKRLLLQCTPIVYVDGRRDVKDEETMTPVGTGTGFIIHPDGYVVTNRHVVESRRNGPVTRLGYDPVRLEWDKDLGLAPAAADVIGVSYQWDLALLKIRGDRKWPRVPLADAADARAGDDVLAAGWPVPQKFGRDHVTITAGKVLGTEVDAGGRPLMVRHSAPTRPGNSGGPVYDLNRGAVVAAHFSSIFARGAGAADPLGEYKPLYAGGVPVARLLWEFPQVAASWQDRCATIDERRALVAYFFQQERFGAAMIESRRALKDAPDDGLASAYLYRMYVRQRDTERAAESLKSARKAPESTFASTVFAAQSTLENGELLESLKWAQAAFALRPNDWRSTLAFVRANLATGSNPDWALGATSQLLPAPSAELEMYKGRAGVQKFLTDARVVRLPPPRQPGGQMLTDTAIALERSLELWPVRNAQACANLALLHAIDGRKKKAADMRAKALRAGPRDVDALLTVAHLDLLQGDGVEAMKIIARAQDVEDKPFGRFLEGWAGLLIAPTVARTDRPKAVALARASVALMSDARDAGRQTWWQAYAAHVQTGLTGR